MTKRDEVTIRSMTRHFAALEKTSSRDVATLAAAAMLHCVEFVRVAGALVAYMPNRTPSAESTLNQLQNLCSDVCGLLTSAPSEESERALRIFDKVGAANEMVSASGIINVINIREEYVPDIKLPGVAGTRKDGI